MHLSTERKVAAQPHQLAVMPDGELLVFSTQVLEQAYLESYDETLTGIWRIAVGRDAIGVALVYDTIWVFNRSSASADGPTLSALALMAAACRVATSRRGG